MLSRESAIEHITRSTSEEAKTISPGSMQSPTGSVTQGFAAITEGHLCFVYEDTTGEVQVLFHELGKIKLIKSDYGVLGKTHFIDTMGEVMQLGGLNTEMEKAIETTLAASQPARQPEASVPAPQSGGGFGQSTQGAGGFGSPPAMQSNRGSGGGSGPVIAGVIVIALVIALGVVGYIFYTSWSEKKNALDATPAVTEPVETVSESSRETAAMEADSPKLRGEEIKIEDAGGSTLLKARKKSSGKYSVKGAIELKVKVDTDRIKVRDLSGATLAKVKRKDYGFKITGSSDETILKGKYRGSGFKVKTDDVDLGKVLADGSGYRIENAAGSLIGTVQVKGKVVEVRDSSGSILRKITGASPKAAAFTVFLDNRLDAQIGVLLYFNEF